MVVVAAEQYVFILQLRVGAFEYSYDVLSVIFFYLELERQLDMPVGISSARYSFAVAESTEQPAELGRGYSQDRGGHLMTDIYLWSREELHRTGLLCLTGSAGSPVYPEGAAAFLHFPVETFADDVKDESCTLPAGSCSPCHLQVPVLGLHQLMIVGKLSVEHDHDFPVQVEIRVVIPFQIGGFHAISHQHHFTSAGAVTEKAPAEIIGEEERPSCGT